MLIISHRGNLDGPDKSRENSIRAIQECITKGLSVEVDLRVHNNKLYLGHDEPQYEIDDEFLFYNKQWLWIHCKDVEALNRASKVGKANYFWHDTDDYTMTSCGYVWAYPGKQSAGSLCILVMPENYWSPKEIKENNTFGVCTDYPKRYFD